MSENDVDEAVSSTIKFLFRFKFLEISVRRLSKEPFHATYHPSAKNLGDN